MESGEAETAMKINAEALAISLEEARAEAYAYQELSDALAKALRDTLPWLERGVKFYKFQRPGWEFYPNREEAEGMVNEVKRVLALLPEAQELRTEKPS